MNSNEDFRITIDVWKIEQLLTITEAALLWTRNTPPPLECYYQIPPEILKEVDLPKLLKESKQKPEDPIFVLDLSKKLSQEALAKLDKHKPSKKTSADSKISISHEDFYSRDSYWEGRADNNLEKFMTRKVGNKDLFDKIRKKLCDGVKRWCQHETQLLKLKCSIEKSATNSEREDAKKELSKFIKKTENLRHLYLKPHEIDKWHLTFNDPPVFREYINPNKTRVCREALAEYSLANNMRPEFLQNDIETFEAKNPPQKTRIHGWIQHIKQKMIEAVPKIQKGDKFPPAKDILRYLVKNSDMEFSIEAIPSVEYCKKFTYENSKGENKNKSFSVFTRFHTEIQKELQRKK